MADFSNPADEVSARELLARLSRMENAVDQLAQADKEGRAAARRQAPRTGTRPGRPAQESAASEVSAEERLNRLRREGLQIEERRTRTTTERFQTQRAEAEQLRRNLLLQREPGPTGPITPVTGGPRTYKNVEDLPQRQALREVEGAIAQRQTAAYQQIASALQQRGAGAVASGAQGLGGSTPSYRAAMRAGGSPGSTGVLQQLGARNTAAQLGQLNTQFQRGGALGTEFFDALRVGAVTLADVRWQLTQTIFKFGGWLVAGSAVFFAADALRELGAGALDSLEGVNTLQRIFPQINTEQAQQQFRDLAGEMNLPISDVADAAYGISKVFGSIRDPAEALQATMAGTRAALFAMKVGELDAATATRYFSAIIQGFKLDFRDLPNLVDTANQAQNRFGGSLPQIIQGVAQAGGQFHALGGNYRDLIALIQTGTRVTGRTGSEIGTGIQRTAEILTRPERRQKIIDLLGIDPADSTVTEVFERAMQVVRHSSREVQTEIARTISTPQLASGRILPILRSRSLYREVQSQLSPDQVKGSAQRELDRALQGPRQQIAALGISLQRLGSSLAQSGVLDGLGLMLRTLNAVLQVSNALVETFTQLPRPLRTAAASLLEIAAVMALLRRFHAIPGLSGLGPNRAGPLPLPIYSPASSGGTGGYTGSALAPTTFAGPATNLGNAARMTDMERRFRTATAGVYASAEGLKRAGVAGRLLGGGIQAASRAATGFGASMIRLGATEVGGFDAAIIATLAAYTLLQQAKDRQNEAGKEIARLDQLISSGTPQQLRANAPKRANALEAAQNAVADAATFLSHLPGGTGRDFGTPQQSENEARAAAQRTAVTRERAQSRGIDLTQEQVRRHLRERLDGARTQEQKQTAIDLARVELSHSLARQAGASGEQKAAAAQTEDSIIQITNNLRAVSGNFQRTLDAVTDYNSAQALEQGIENAITVRGLTGRNAGRAAAASARFRALASNAQKPAEIQKFLKLADSLDQQIETEAKQRLDRALEFSATPAQSHQARVGYLRTQYRRYIGGMRQQIDVLRRRVRGESGDIRDAQKELQGLDNGPAKPADENFLLHGSELGRLPAANQKEASALAKRRKDIESHIAALKKTRNLKRGAIKDLESELKQNREDYDYLKQQMARDDFTEGAEADQALYDVRIASTSDPITKARLTVAKARSNLRSVREGFRKGFKNLADLRHALASYRDTLQSVAQEIISDYQSQQAVETARFALTTRDPVTIARHAEQTARDALQKVRSTPHHTKDESRDAQRALLEARKNTADVIRAEAEAMIQANLAFALAGTDDPVRQALLNLRAAQRSARKVPGDSPSARRQQQAQIRQFQRGYLQAKQQQKYDDIEFESSIGKITAEVELSRLQAFLKTIRDNKALKRTVMQRIYALKKELEDSTDIELNVGDIRLPTLYDVRRLARQGTNNPMQFQQSNVIHVSGAGDPDTVATAVVSRMADHTDRGLRSAQRAAGVR